MTVRCASSHNFGPSRPFELKMKIVEASWQLYEKSCQICLLKLLASVSGSKLLHAYLVIAQ